jgi:hypothetical protein
MQKKFDQEKSQLLEDFANESKAQLCVSEKQISELEKVINTLMAKLEEEKKNNVEALEKLKREFSTQNVLLETNLNVDFETRLAAVNAEKDEIQTRLTDYEYKYSSLEQTTNSMKIQNKGHEEKVAFFVNVVMEIVSYRELKRCNCVFFHQLVQTTVGANGQAKRACSQNRRRKQVVEGKTCRI